MLYSNIMRGERGVKLYLFYFLNKIFLHTCIRVQNKLPRNSRATPKTKPHQSKHFRDLCLFAKVLNTVYFKLPLSKLRRIYINYNTVYIKIKTLRNKPKFSSKSYKMFNLSLQVLCTDVLPQHLLLAYFSSFLMYSFLWGAELVQFLCFQHEMHLKL